MEQEARIIRVPLDQRTKNEILRLYNGDWEIQAIAKYMQIEEWVIRKCFKHWFPHVKILSR